MPPAENRRRRRGDRKSKPNVSPWGSLLQDDAEAGEGLPRVSPEDNAPLYEAEDDAEAPVATWRDLWHKFSFWSLIATILFCAFIGGLCLLVYRMWSPQDMRLIAGYADKGTARDLSAAVKNANGAELIFTEGEINRFLRDTCRLRQADLSSIFAHAQGVAVRIHDGYAELIIDRVISTHFHQTTAVHLSFVRELDHGRPKIRVELRGGEPIMGSLPCGGYIGQVPVPQRYMQMLRPALETLQECYPDMFETLEAYGYKPEFCHGRSGQESYVRLVPYTSETSL